MEGYANFVYTEKFGRYAKYCGYTKVRRHLRGINMIKPNWHTFKANFSENPQSNFEWFCYLLFCKEFKQDKGVFRYKNQSAIETNPVETGDEVIGWQAKFYETSLSKHKKEILETLERARRDYPKITKIIFFIHANKEWAQNKGRKPKGLKEVEEKAKVNLPLFLLRTKLLLNTFLHLIKVFLI